MRTDAPGKWLSGLLGSAWPVCCLADYGGSWLRFGRAEEFGFFALLAVPTAVACVLTEALVPRRRVPWWLGAPCALVAVIGILLAATSGPGSDLIFLWFLVPPMSTLALRGALPDPMQRLLAGWVVAGVAIAVGLAKHHGTDDLLILLGGAAPCLLLWSSVVLILLARNILPEPQRERTQRSELRAATAAFAPAAASARAAIDPVLARIDQVLQPAQTGLTWWLGAALVFYFGIGAAIAAGALSGGMWIYVELQQLFDTFELPQPRLLPARQLWWFVGLPWSLVAGAAVWGLAGTLGMFNPGRARIARFAGIVFGGALLVWTATIIMHIRQIDAAEERAVRGQR